jgi:hypothetical protein
MKRNVSIFAAAVLCLGMSAAAFAGDAEPPRDLPPDEAADKALEEIEAALMRGDIGWWQSTADPVIQFTSKYTGLGSDTVTVLSLNQMEKLWPSWKTVSGGLDRFGSAVTVYTCIKHAYDGDYDKLALEALKKFLTTKLQSMGEGAALSAAGVGLIDFALNSFGEAAMQQVSDDFWWFYCRYQSRRHPSLAAYVRLITEGDGARKGFAAVAASLDSFWDDPETAGIRGFHTLVAQDPDYKATLRNRYIKENLLNFLTMWAERERDKARTGAWLAARRFAEEVGKTVIAVEFSIIEKGLGEPPKGTTAELCLQTYNATGGTDTKVLASAPLVKDMKFEVPLASLLDAKKHMPRKLLIRLQRPGYKEGARESGRDLFDVEMTDTGSKWKREPAAGRLVYRARAPFIVENYAEVTVTLAGQGADKIGGASFHSLPGAVAINPRDLCRVSLYYGASVTPKDAPAKLRLAYGRYIVMSDSVDYTVAPGPVTVDGDMAYTVDVKPVSKDDTAAPAAPDPAKLKELLLRPMADIKSRAKLPAAAASETSAAVADYWQSAFLAMAGLARAQRALELKMAEELKQPKLTSEQQTAIYKSYRPKIDAVNKTWNDARAALPAAVDAASKEFEAVDKDLRAHHAEVLKELRAADDDVSKLFSGITQKLYPLNSKHREISMLVTGGALNYLPTAEMDAKLAAARKTLAEIESAVPAMMAEYEKLAPAAERYARAAAAVRDVDEKEGVTVYSNPRDYAGQIAAIGQTVEMLRDTKFADDARALMDKAEKMADKRRARRALAAGALQRLEAAAAAIPAVDIEAWKARSAEFSKRAEPLFAGPDAADRPDDTEAFTKLAADIEAFLREQIEICGDMLAEPAKKETGFSRFQQAYKEIIDSQSWANLPQDWHQKFAQSSWDKIRARGAAAHEIFTLRNDIRIWLAAGKTRETRAAALKKTVDALTPKKGEALGVEERLAALDAQMRIFDELPRRVLPADTFRAWEKARVDLARGGAVDTWLRQKGKPFIVMDTVNAKPCGKAIYWPETAPNGMPANSNGWCGATLTVEGAGADALIIMRQSTDSGKNWSMVRSRGGKWYVNLPMSVAGLKSLMFEAALSDGQEIKCIPSLPQFMAP